MNATINTRTEITTAARRIARDLNRTVKEVTTAYDRDGRQIDAWPSDMHHVQRPAHLDDAVLIMSGTRHEHMTWRDVQDRLDAGAFAAAHPESPWAYTEYLDDVEAAREREAGRTL
jgi:hypothetical protein